MIDQETTAAPITTEYNDGTVTVEVYETMRGGDVDDYHTDPDRYLERIPRIGVQMASGRTYGDLDIDTDTHDPDEYQAFSFWLNPSQAVRLARSLADSAATACGLPEKRLTFLHRELERLEGLAGGKTIAEIAENGYQS